MTEGEPGQEVSLLPDLVFVVAGEQNAVCDWRPARGEQY